MDDFGKKSANSLHKMDEQSLLDFFLKLDRRLFLDSSASTFARLDQPLPIGFGQTISQPSLVVEMTRQLSPEPDSRVLEIGTGSGYQTAFLAAFSKEIFTVELIPDLSLKAKERLDAMGYTNVHYLIGDGSLGWKEESPFDRIIVTAAAGQLPEELVKQLKPGGRMVIPVGPEGNQELFLVTRDEMGRVNQQSIERVAFVELRGKYGWM